jgi:hypothetical protein
LFPFIGRRAFFLRISPDFGKGTGRTGQMKGAVRPIRASGAHFRGSAAMNE